MTADAAALAAEIRRHVFPSVALGHVAYRSWYHTSSPLADLPEALAADLLAAGWQPPASRPLTPEELAEWPPTRDPEAMRAAGHVPLRDYNDPKRGITFRGNWMKPEVNE